MPSTWWVSSIMTFPSSVLFREIYKNAWLRKLPVPEKKTGVHPKKGERVWTVFCVHDDTDPFLELYSDQKLAATHKPDWCVSLSATLHISPTICPDDEEYEFVITLPNDAIRLTAPSWDLMMEWVDGLGTKLREMKILSPKENVYSRMPELRQPLLPTRDPNSPLPLPPVGPSTLVPGVEPLTLTNPPTNTGENSREEEPSTTVEDRSSNTQNEPLGRSESQRSGTSTSSVYIAQTTHSDLPLYFRSQSVPETSPVRDANVTVIQVSAANSSRSNAGPLTSPPTSDAFDFSFVSSSLNHDVLPDGSSVSEGGSRGTAEEDGEEEFFTPPVTPVFPRQVIRRPVTVNPVPRPRPSNLSEHSVRQRTTPNTVVTTDDSQQQQNVTKCDLLMSSSYSGVSVTSSSSSSSSASSSSYALARPQNSTQDSAHLISQSETNHQPPPISRSNENSTVNGDQLTPHQADVDNDSSNHYEHVFLSSSQFSPATVVMPDTVPVGGHLRGHRPRRRSTENSAPATPSSVGVDRIRRLQPPPHPFRQGLSVSEANMSNASRLTLREQQVLQLRREIMHPGGIRLQLRRKDCLGSIALVDAYNAVWVAGWKQKEHPMLYNALHIGDQIRSIAGVIVHNANDAQKLIRGAPSLYVEFIIRRVPCGRVFALRRESEGQNIGIILESNTAEVKEVVAGSLAATQGLSSRTPTLDALSLTTWVITEVNGRPLNLFFKDGEVKDRLNAVGLDISLLVQPSDLIKQIKKQLKAMRSYKDYIVQ